jgi:hypothetical protein
MERALGLPYGAQHRDRIREDHRFHKQNVAASVPPQHVTGNLSCEHDVRDTDWVDYKCKDGASAVF